MKSAICNLNLRDLFIWPLLVDKTAAADKLIVAISRVKSGVVALGSVNEALQAVGEGLAWEGSWKSEFWRINRSGFRLFGFRVGVQGSG